MRNDSREEPLQVYACRQCAEKIARAEALEAENERLRLALSVTDISPQAVAVLAGKKCACTYEAGDSPCPIHGDDL